MILTGTFKPQKSVVCKILPYLHIGLWQGTQNASNSHSIQKIEKGIRCTFYCVQQRLPFCQSYVSRGGGGTTIGRWYGGMPYMHGHDPLFQDSQCSIGYQFTINSLLMCPHLKIICIFSAPKMQTFCIFEDYSFFKENPTPKPYFWKPTWHISTKKS